MRTLIVEDDFFWQLKIKETVLQAGLKIDFLAHNIIEAEQFLNCERPDLIIADIHLENDSIFDLLCKEEYKSIPTILTTSSELKQDYKKSKQLLNTAYIVKPFHKHTLLSVLQILTKKNEDTAKINTARQFMTIAHDLKSPFANFEGIFSAIQYLVNENDFETIGLISKEMICKSKNLNLLIDNILDWGLLAQNMINPTLISTNLHQLITQITPAYENIAAVKQIKISVEISNAFEIKTDKSILSIILRNLIDNAVKFSTATSIITIKTIYNRDRKNIISISNSVSCLNKINTKLINTIFKSDDFFEPHSNGFGLGISLIHWNMKILKGSIKATLDNNLLKFELALP